MPLLDFPFNPIEGTLWTDNDGADWLFWRAAWTRVGGATTTVSVPTGSLVAYASTVPPSGYLYCNGAAVSRDTYSGLYNIIADTYGAGDGSTTFNLPDCRARVLSGLDDLLGVIVNPTADAMGGTLGAELHQLTEAELPLHSHTGIADSAGSHGHSGSTGSDSHTHTGTVNSNGNHSHTYSTRAQSNLNTDNNQGHSYGSTFTATTSTSGSHNHSFTTGSDSHSHSLSINSAGSHEHTITVGAIGSDAAHNNIQPTMFVVWMIKI